MNYLHLSLLSLLLIHTIICAPLQDSSNYKNMFPKECIHCQLKDTKGNQLEEAKRLSVYKTFKKDVFVSRGWGAGGMPFSVLYMSPSHSSKAPATDTIDKSAAVNTPKQQHKSIPQVRNSMRQKNLHRISHSVIPQLFVSYGWGPHGKK